MSISTAPSITGVDLNSVSGIDASSATTRTSLSLTATATKQLQAIGAARKLYFTAAGTGSFYIKFTTGMASLTVTTTDTQISLTSTTKAYLIVPSGYMYFEFLRAGGSDYSFVVALQS